MKPLLKVFPCVALVMSLMACQTANTSRSLTQSQLPPIASNLVAGGKGIPNGRSDAGQPFFVRPLAVSGEPGYGYSQSKPISVPVRLHALYLNALRGPQGEPVEYERLGSCCLSASAAAIPRSGPLDIYRLRVDGSPQPLFLFLNGYDAAPPMIAAGFTQRVAAVGYLLEATFAYYPVRAGQAIEELVLPIRASFPNRAQCEDYMRQRTSAHIRIYGLKKTRPLPQGTLCREVHSSVPLTADADEAYRAEIIGDIKTSPDRLRMLSTLEQ